MPQYSQDRCSNCDNKTSPELLAIKRVQFLDRTNNKKILKSRVVAWLCESCLNKDEDWNREAYSSPGHDSPALERVRAARGRK